MKLNVKIIMISKKIDAKISTMLIYIYILYMIYMATTYYFNNKNLTKYFKDIDFDNLNLENNIDNNNDSVENQFSCNNNNKLKTTIPICETCEFSNFINDITNGIIVCGNCGQVLEEIIDCNPEWKNYEEDSSVGRCGMPINVLLPQSSLGTSVQGMLPNRLKILHQWNSMPYKERSLNNVFKKIIEICNKHGILKCIEDDAKIMYKIASETMRKGNNKNKLVITRGINRTSIIASCIFFACKRKNMTRTPKEIADMFHLTLVEMNRGCKNFLKLINLKNFDMNMGISSAEHFIKRHCNKLMLKTIYTEKALQIAKNIDNLNIASVHTPPSLAAASILLMAEVNGLNTITKKKLSIEFEVSEVTISKTFKKLEQYKEIICNNKISDDIIEKIDLTNNSNEISDVLLERMKKFGINTNIEEKYNSCDNNNLKESVLLENNKEINQKKKHFENKLLQSKALINKNYNCLIKKTKNYNSYKEKIMKIREMKKKEFDNLINLIFDKIKSSNK
jgi:transcription initiation factor TFIIIB Brf1 subunit/transcription initiation factor TFIIB